MSFFPMGNIARLEYCLTCGGTGRRGGNLGSKKKKKCQTCDGSGKRTVEVDPDGRTVCDDFSQVTIPACFYPRIGCFTRSEPIEIDFSVTRAGENFDE